MGSGRGPSKKRVIKLAAAPRRTFSDSPLGDRIRCDSRVPRHSLTVALPPPGTQLSLPSFASARILRVDSRRYANIAQLQQLHPQTQLAAAQPPMLLQSQPQLQPGGAMHSGPCLCLCVCVFCRHGK